MNVLWVLGAVAFWVTVAALAAWAVYLTVMFVLGELDKP